MIVAALDSPETLAATGMAMPITLAGGALVGWSLAQPSWIPIDGWMPRCGAWRLALGSPVNVRVGNQEIAGTVTAHDTDSLRLREAPLGEFVAYPVREASLVVGARSRGRNALIGAAIGAAVGSVLGGQDATTADAVVSGIAYGGLIGAVTARTKRQAIALGCP
jgi:hypothetical protein